MYDMNHGINNIIDMKAAAKGSLSDKDLQLLKRTYCKLT
jgi:hypothetical protein